MADLDKYYTPTEKAKAYIKKVDDLYNLGSFDYILEPSAGSGAFSLNLPLNTIAIDLVPEHPAIQQMDFFDFDFPKGKGLAIGNPPYGRRADFAKLFFNKCALHCDVIAFVLPRSMTRKSMWSNISKSFHLKYEEYLDDFEYPDGTYFFRRSIFQIWERDDFNERPDFRPDKTHPDFVIHHANTWTDKAKQDRIKDTCSIGLGCASLKIGPSKHKWFNKGSNWFIEPLEPYVEDIFFTLMSFKHLADKSACAPSIAKPDIVEEYKKKKLTYLKNKKK